MRKKNLSKQGCGNRKEILELCRLLAREMNLLLKLKAGKLTIGADEFFFFFLSHPNRLLYRVTKEFTLFIAGNARPEHRFFFVNPIRQQFPLVEQINQILVMGW